MKVLVVGGVAGGATTCARLRRLDEKAEIIMLERGEYISYANCGLPYYIGEEIKDKEALTLQTPESFKSRFNIDVRIFNEAISIDKEKKVVTIKNLKTSQTYEESYDKLVLSMGAEPVKPPIPGIDSNKVFTLRNIPDTFKIKEFIDDNRPKSIVVVGGGFIGVEMAENLKHGSSAKVSLVEMQNQVIAPLDPDMASDVHNHMIEKGINLMLNTGVEAIVENGDSLKINLSNGEIDADMVIMAIGVRPETKLAKEAGLNLNPKGSIIVNEKMLTSDENIFALGDAIEIVDFVTNEKGYIPLAGPANKQGRIVADNICGIESVYTGTQGSSVLKVFDLTVASTGLNEKAAKRLNINYDKVFTFSGNHAGYYPNAKFISIKTIFEKDSGKILGAQLVGYEGTDKRCDVIATAIRFGATAHDLTKLELCYAPPYSSAKDPVNMAGFVIENLLTNKVKNFHWHEIEELQNKNDVILLDTRTTSEFSNGSIDKFINIPLDSLRDRLNELDKSKKIYVTCQVGLRGYVASRILSENGFDVYNLSGGYRLYSSIYKYDK